MDFNLWFYSIFRICFVWAGNFRELIEYLNGTSDLLAKNGNILDNVLETLDVQQHSLGVLYVLVAKFTNLSVSRNTVATHNLILLFQIFILICCFYIV